MRGKREGIFAHQSDCAAAPDFRVARRKSGLTFPLLKNMTD